MKQKRQFILLFFLTISFVCFGPCSQKVMETSQELLQDSCVLGYSEINPETVILDYFEKQEKRREKVGQ